MTFSGLAHPALCCSRASKCVIRRRRRILSARPPKRKEMHMDRSRPGSLQLSSAPDAVEWISGRLDAGVLFICDHASNAVPEGYGALGLPPAEFERHIAYDIGAAAVTRRLAELIGAPAILSRFSRLLIDPNRGADDPTLVMRLSDGAIIPGNAAISEAEIERRLALYWRPYRDAISQSVEAMMKSGRIPAILSIHSFTPTWRGSPRPWEVGV